MKVMKLFFSCLLVLLLFIVAYILRIVYLELNKDDLEEKKRQKYIDILSCVPEKPIDKGIIFAEAMRQYWQKELHSLWFRDENRERGFNNGETDAVCGLKRDFLGKPKSEINKLCYPVVIRGYGESMTRDVYDPNKNQFLYLPENFNKDVDFQVDMKFGFLHKEDCCRLLTYDEMQDEYKNLQLHKTFKVFVNPFYKTQSDVLNTDIIKNIYFLRIKKIGSVEFVNYYPVSMCGNIVFLDSNN